MICVICCRTKSCNCRLSFVAVFFFLLQFSFKWFCEHAKRAYGKVRRAQGTGHSSPFQSVSPAKQKPTTQLFSAIFFPQTELICMCYVAPWRCRCPASPSLLLCMRSNFFINQKLCRHSRRRRTLTHSLAHDRYGRPSCFAMDGWLFVLRSLRSPVDTSGVKNSLPSIACDVLMELYETISLQCAYYAIRTPIISFELRSVMWTCSTPPLRVASNGSDSNAVPLSLAHDTHTHASHECACAVKKEHSTFCAIFRFLHADSVCVCVWFSFFLFGCFGSFYRCRPSDGYRLFK